MSETPPDRSFVREESVETVYFIREGVRWGFSSLESLYFTGKTLGDVVVVPDGSLAGIPLKPKDGTYFQDGGKTGHLFVMLGGARFRAHTDNRVAMGVPLDQVIGVPWGSYEQIPYPGRYQSWLGRSLTSRLARQLVLLHRPWPQQVVWLAVGGIIGGALAPLGEWLAGLVT